MTNSTRRVLIPSHAAGADAFRTALGLAINGAKAAEGESTGLLLLPSWRQLEFGVIPDTIGDCYAKILRRGDLVRYNGVLRLIATTEQAQRGVPKGVFDIVIVPFAN
ncbi:MAG: hypothetical protein ACQER1_05505 [Armatimonadota bacterium]